MEKCKFLSRNDFKRNKKSRSQLPWNGINLFAIFYYCKEGGYVTT